MRVKTEASHVGMTFGGLPRNYAVNNIQNRIGGWVVRSMPVNGSAGFRIPSCGGETDSLLG